MIKMSKKYLLNIPEKIRKWLDKTFFFSKNDEHFKMYIYNPDNYLDPLKVDHFRLLANWFLCFCSDLAVLIFVTIVADIQRPNWKLALGSQGGDIQSLTEGYILYVIIWDVHQFIGHCLIPLDSWFWCLWIQSL